LRSNTNADGGQVARKGQSRSLRPAKAGLLALRLVLLFAVIFHLVSSENALAQPSDENRMKAAFLFHFAQLVEWPSDAFDGSDGSLVLCTLEDDSFYDELENTIQGKQIGSRTIRIRHVHFSQAAHDCNMLFISVNRSKGVPLTTFRNLPILTVGETDDFLSSGGMIRFHREEDKIRFDVNLGAADSSHIKISSRLLMLATSVIRGGGMNHGR
jgi:YfiR/HmsC-like